MAMAKVIPTPLPPPVTAMVRPVREKSCGVGAFAGVRRLSGTTAGVARSLIIGIGGTPSLAIAEGAIICDEREEERR